MQLVKRLHHRSGALLNTLQFLVAKEGTSSPAAFKSLHNNHKPVCKETCTTSDCLLLACNLACGQSLMYVQYIDSSVYIAAQPVFGDMAVPTKRMQKTLSSCMSCLNYLLVQGSCTDLDEAGVVASLWQHAEKFRRMRCALCCLEFCQHQV